MTADGTVQALNRNVRKFEVKNVVPSCDSAMNAVSLANYFFSASACMGEDAASSILVAN